MNYEEKIKELTERIEYLEKKEHKRELKKKIKLTWTIIKILIVIIILLFTYYSIYKKIIKPYQNKVDYIEEKVNNVESFVQEKWKSIKKYIPFQN